VVVVVVVPVLQVETARIREMEQHLEVLAAQVESVFRFP
jgi:hypothetical protein